MCGIKSKIVWKCASIVAGVEIFYVLLLILIMADKKKEPLSNLRLSNEIP